MDIEKAWCGDCGVELEQVRPGKHQHPDPDCSQSVRKVQALEAWLEHGDRCRKCNVNSWGDPDNMWPDSCGEYWRLWKAYKTLCVGR